MTRRARVSAIVPVFDRVEMTLKTLGRLGACDPPPSEILVHVDGGQHGLADAIARAFPSVRLFVSAANVGPGGARNILTEAAAEDLVATFDDDSWPIDPDYFARVETLFAALSDFSLIAASIIHIGETVAEARREYAVVADFVNCGCAFRRADVITAGGYVPIPIAYGMEELDLAIRLRAAGKNVAWSPWLRIWHATDFSHHARPRVVAASISNLAILAYVRYPVLLWPLGAAQALRRALWLFQIKRRDGIMSGFGEIPRRVWKYRAWRRPVRVEDILGYLRRRRSMATRPLPGPGSAPP